MDFELELVTAQTHDSPAGSLRVRGARGGPRVLARPFCIGINDPLGMLPSVLGACETSGGFNPRVFDRSKQLMPLLEAPPSYKHLCATVLQQG